MPDPSTPEPSILAGSKSTGRMLYESFEKLRASSMIWLFRNVDEDPSLVIFECFLKDIS